MTPPAPLDSRTKIENPISSLPQKRMPSVTSSVECRLDRGLHHNIATKDQEKTEFLKWSLDIILPEDSDRPRKLQLYGGTLHQDYFCRDIHRCRQVPSCAGHIESVYVIKTIYNQHFERIVD